MRQALLSILLALVLQPVHTYAGIQKCIGPNGEMKFTDRECPEGYVLEGSESTQTRQTDQSEDPYFCEYVEVVSPSEIADALAETRGSLAAAKRNIDSQKIGYWEDCLAQLIDRDTKLKSMENGEAETVNYKGWCTKGYFTSEGGTIYFTNETDHSCGKLFADCRYSYEMLIRSGRGRYESYEQKEIRRVGKEILYEGKIFAREKREIYDVPDSTVHDVRCVFKKVQ